MIVFVQPADVPVASSPRSRPTVPLLAAVMNIATAAKVELPLNQDKTAAVLAELRRPTDTNELRKSQRMSSDQAAEQTSGMSVFSQAAVSEILVSVLAARVHEVLCCVSYQTT